MLELKLRETVLYVADKPSQPVHSAHYESVMKSAFVVVPCQIDEVDIEELLEQGKLKITPYVECVQAVVKDSRNIFKCVTMLLDVTIRCNN